MRDKPINLNFFTISFPITAIVSILHRISGFALFFFIPFLLSLLQLTLHSPFVFDFSVLAKIFIWLILSALLYHMFAGIRHVCMDLGYFESLKAARLTALIVLIISIFSSIGLGMVIC